MKKRTDVVTVWLIESRMTRTNLQHLLEVAQLRVQRGKRNADQQREAVTALERAGHDATTAKRLLEISEQALAFHAANRDRLTNEVVGLREARREVVRNLRD